MAGVMGGRMWVRSRSSDSDRADSAATGQERVSIDLPEDRRDCGVRSGSKIDRVEGVKFI